MQRNGKSTNFLYLQINNIDHTHKYLILVQNSKMSTVLHTRHKEKISVEEWQP